MNMLFCNTAYMEYYDSDKSDDTMGNGGAYVVQNGTGIEIDNFHNFNGMCYGGVETGFHKGTRRQLKIEKIAAGIGNAESLADVTVIFCARSAALNKTVIVGWYEHATVYRRYKYVKDDRANKQPREYNIAALACDCYLIPGAQRGFVVPRTSDGLGYGFGQSQVWFANRYNPKITTGQALVNFRNSVIVYINGLKNSGLKPCGVKPAAGASVGLPAANPPAEGYAPDAAPAENVSRNGHGAALDGYGNPTGIVSPNISRSAEPDPDPKPVLTVNAYLSDDEYGQPIYLRQKSLGKYGGDHWKAAPVYSAAKPYNAYFLTRDAMREEKVWGYDRYWGSYPTDKLRYPVRDIKISLEASVKQFLYPCFAYVENSKAGDVVIGGAFGATNGYKLKFIPSDNRPHCKAALPSQAAIEAKYCAFVRKNYLHVPAETKRIIRDNITNNWQINEHWDFWDIVGVVSMYFNEYCTYSYNFNYPARVKDMVGYFVRGKTEFKGICNHFASAATLIFRVLDIPARYVVGYVCNAENSGDTPVTTNDAHAWVEIYREGLGWIIFDPTLCVKKE